MTMAFAYTIYSRIPLEVDVIRDRGQLYVENSKGHIENIYTLKLANKEQVDHRYTISISGIEGLEYIGQNEVNIRAGELLDLSVRLSIDPRYLSHSNNVIYFEVQAMDQPEIYITEENRFIGPSATR